MTVYKAQWPLSANHPHPGILLYEADAAYEARKVRMVPASDDLKRDLFQDGKYIRVFFEGEITAGDTLIIKELVRRDQWR